MSAMKEIYLAVLCLLLCSCATSPQNVHVYYGVVSPVKISENVTIPSTANIQGSFLACEDGYITAHNGFQRMSEEYQRNPRDSAELLGERANKYRRDFPVRNATGSTPRTINVPTCTIAWPSGYSHEFPSFSIDLTEITLPHEVTKSFERVFSGDARDLQDLNAVREAIRNFENEVDAMNAAQRQVYPSAAAQQQTSQPAPVFRPQPLPTTPTVPFPSAPGRTTTICRTLSNGTIVCD